MIEPRQFAAKAVFSSRPIDVVDEAAGTTRIDEDRAESPAFVEIQEPPDAAGVTPGIDQGALQAKREILALARDVASGQNVVDDEPARHEIERKRIDFRLPRLWNNPPLLVSLMLGALIAAELGRASVLLIGERQARASEITPTHSIPIRKQQTLDVHDIVAAHLFGVFVEDPNSRDPAKARPTTANLLLAGTIATDDPKHGLAIIGDGGPARVYKVGDPVGGASLYSVYLDHVILDRNGRLETLALPRLQLAGRKSVDQSAQVARAAEVDEPAIPDAPKSRTAADVLRTNASMSPDGKLRGFRVYANGNREAFDRAGLRGGDLVVAVNGTSVQDQDRQTAKDIFGTLNTSNQATVTVERNGQRRDVIINAAPAEE